MDIINSTGKKRKENKKYVGSCCGNSFVIFDYRDVELSRKSRIDFAISNIAKYKVDSALFLTKSKKADVFVEIFEKNGSESESCGNGAILVSQLLGLDNGKIEMKSGIINVVGNLKKWMILMDIKFSSIKKVDCGKSCIFVKFGEPHTVYLVDNLKNFDLVKTGKELQKKYPKGINVDVIQKVDNFCYLIKTYERGVLAKTKSCGTGSLASYLAISYFNDKIYKEPIEFRSVGGSHWVSRDKNMLKLETFKKFCKIRALKFNII